MHIEFDYLSDAQKLAVAKSLGVGPSKTGTFRLEASDANADELLLAARVHCLSKVIIPTCNVFMLVYL